MCFFRVMTPHLGGGVCYYDMAEFQEVLRAMRLSARAGSHRGYSSPPTSGGRRTQSLRRDGFYTIAQRKAAAGTSRTSGEVRLALSKV